MIPTSFNQETDVLGPPAGLTEAEVSSLSVFRGLNSAGVPVVISCWKMTKDEIEEFNRTGRIWLCVVGETMSPSVLTAICPFID